jgi:NAD(P)H-hydrate repair Nnr-like enzyme with NAD(P)H-hydrate dehydratase domain
VLLKGPATVVCGDRQSIHNPDGDRDAPWLATAGSGDVLAGIITGLLARGADAQLAGEAGVWLHAEAARIFGPGLIAEDLPEMLPKVYASRHI